MPLDLDPAVQRMWLAEEMAVVEEGARAARKGEPIEANPYRERTDNWGAWRGGWRRPSMYLGDE